MSLSTPDATPVDLSDSRSFVDEVPHAWLAYLRLHDPVHWQDEPGGPGYWAVTKYHDCVTVNREVDRFSSAARGTMPFELGEDEIANQSLMMLNMDPPLHTRYRRLVNKAFTPRMVLDLEASMHRSADAIIDQVCAAGEADFVTDLAAELPLQVIAELLGVPPDDRQKMFDWSNRMVGSEDPEYQQQADMAMNAAMELYAYASELFAKKRIDPHADLMSVLSAVEVDGERLSSMELELFFLLLTVAGNETTRNLMSGAMHALLPGPRSVGAALRRPLLAAAPSRRGDVALRHAGDELSPNRHVRYRAQRNNNPARRQSRLLPCVGQSGRGHLRESRSASTSHVTRIPTSRSEAGDRTSASARTWPVWRSG